MRNLHQGSKQNDNQPLPPEPAAEVPSPGFTFSDITIAGELYLLHEIASLPMTEMSSRAVSASKGTEGKIVKMLGFDGTQSSPLSPANTASAVTSTSTPPRAPSTPSSRRTRLFSPSPFSQLTRRLSISPLAARNSRAALPPSKSLTTLAEFNQKMSTPPTPDTVRKRRGFRPLSIVTSALFPFDFDPVQTMEDAQNGQLGLDSPLKNLRFSDNKAKHAKQQGPSPVTSETSSDTSPSPSKAASIETEAGGPQHSAPDRDDLSITSTIAVKKTEPVTKPEVEKISVAEYLKRQKSAARASQEGNAAPADTKLNNVLVTDEYPQFYNLPPPDPSKHPMYRTDPFNCTSEAPPMMTNWTKYEIRQWAADKYLRDRGMLLEQTPDGKSSARKKKFLPFDNKSPDKEETSIFDALTEGSPAPASTKRRHYQTPRRDTTGTATSTDLRIAPSTSEPVTDDLDKKSVGFRSLSNLFRTRSSTDKASTISISSPIEPSSAHPAATPELKRYDLERYLRIICNCPSIEFTWASMYPRHPNTSKEWKSRNLKCTNCLSVCCGVCGRACCAYKAATLGAENHKNNPPGREEAYQRIVDISTVFPYGKEAPTFLECTSCKNMVCPDCCGVCPVDACGDLQCRRCKKPDPWRECSWHNVESMSCVNLGTSDEASST